MEELRNYSFTLQAYDVTNVAIWFLSRGFFCVVVLPRRLHLFDRSCGVRFVRLDPVAAPNMSLNKASAWRIKYRDMTSSQKIRVSIENMGVHECNRSGVYPAGIRCRD